MPTLLQYWTDEVTRIGTALAGAQSDLATLRSDLLSAEAEQRNTADAVRESSDAVAAARRALAAIPMPADGDPLLDDMEDALVALRAAQAELANGNLALLLQRAQQQQAEQTVQGLTADLAAAQAAKAAAQTAADARQALADKFAVGGSLENLVSDALAALAAHKADASARVEDEFPSNSGDADKSLLDRVRARAALLQDIAAATARIESAAWTANNTALAKAQRDFNAALAALQATADAAAQVAADSATLARLAALPVPNPPLSYPILTPWQHALLHDTDLQTQREDTLALLTAIDTKRHDLIAPEEAYYKALYVARANEPDKTIAQLDATTLATERSALDAALQAVQDARDDYDALPADDREALDNWFAAVPDKLWAELDALDGAVARLEKLSGSPTPADLIAALTAAEVALEAALRASREEERSTQGGLAALAEATASLSAVRDSLSARRAAMTRSSAQF